MAKFKRGDVVVLKLRDTIIDESDTSIRDGQRVRVIEFDVSDGSYWVCPMDGSAETDNMLDCDGIWANENELHRESRRKTKPVQHDFTRRINWRRPLN